LTIIGPTSARKFRPPSATGAPSVGVHPVGIKNAVIKPHAINAAMFGMTIPDKNVPNF
jgi:hypothetical protein